MSSPDNEATTPFFPAFFIVGVGRSGTTLARAMITGHPLLTVPAETGFLPTLLRLRYIWWSQHGVRAGIFTKLAFANGRLARAGLDRSELQRSLTEHKPSTPQGAISRIYEMCASGQPGERVGDKTPGYGEHVELLARYFPEAKFIHVVRHPLDVVASLLRQPWGPNDPLAAGHQWLRGVLAVSRARIPAQKLMVVRLEELTRSPSTVVAGMAQHLGVDTHEEMLNFNTRADMIQNENVHPSSHIGLSRALTSTHRWEQELSEDDARRVWSLVRTTAEEFGYSGPDGQIPHVSSTVASMRFAYFNTSRSWRRLRTLARLIRA